jgi:6-phosphogluconolactonase
MIKNVLFERRIDPAASIIVLRFKFSQELGMLQKALSLVIALASIAACIGCSNSSHFLFAALPATNQVAVYREDPTAGVLTQIAGSPFAAGDGAFSLVLHPSGRFLYVANPGQNENDISLFTIASNGVPSEIFPRTSVAPDATQPTLLVMDPAGSFLYVMNAGSSNISVFSINAKSGVLSPVANSPFNIGLPLLNMQPTPSGNFLYVTAVGQNNGLILGFSVTSGSLTLASQIANSDGTNPLGLAIDPTGTFLYVANTSSNSISIFKISSSGVLSEVSGSPLNTYNAPIALLLDPKGQFLYVADQASNNIAVYSITAGTGLPVGLTTSTSLFAFATETSPSVLALDSNGNHLYVGNQGSSAGIQSFQVSSGNLNPIFTYKVGNTPSSIAILQ